MKPGLSLSVKFNLVFLIIFAIALVVIGVVSDRLLQKQALEETAHDANILASAASSTIGPRDVLIRIAVGFIRLSSRSPMR